MRPSSGAGDPAPARRRRFPRALRVDLAYHRAEDRLAADFALGDAVRRVWLTRPVALAAIARLSAVLRDAAPWRGRVAGGAVAEAERLERDVAVACGERDGAIRRGVGAAAAPAAGPAFLATHALVEVSTAGDGRVLLGFEGVAAGSDDAALPLAALSLDRRQAHQALAALEERARGAGWTATAPSAPRPAVH